MYAGSSRVKVNYSCANGGVRATMKRVNARDVQNGDRKIEGRPSVFLDCKVNNLLELTIPFYSRLRARVCGPARYQGVIPGVELATYGAPSAVLKNGTNSSTLTDALNDMEIYTSGGDDLSFFFLVGPPPIALRAANDSG